MSEISKTFESLSCRASSLRNKVLELRERETKKSGGEGMQPDKQFVLGHWWLFLLLSKVFTTFQSLMELGLTEMVRLRLRLCFCMLCSAEVDTNGGASNPDNPSELTPQQEPRGKKPVSLSLPSFADCRGRLPLLPPTPLRKTACKGRGQTGGAFGPPQDVDIE